MNKTKFKVFIKQTLWIFSLIMISGILTLLGAVVLYLCGVNLSSHGPIILILLTMLSCVIISGVLVTVSAKRASRAFEKVRESLDRIANGDFNHKLELNSKNTYVVEFVNSVNKISDELSSTAILKNDFVRNFSHEFKTPIVSIKGFSELLCNDKTLSEEEKEKFYRIIYEESERLSNLANSSLLLSKLDSQSIVVNKEDFYLDEQIEECALQFYKQVEQKNIEVQIELNRLPCRASKELLRELWLNLLSNAVKYTNQNGHIKIYSKKEPSGFSVCFEDDGVGISNEATAHIFDEYYQEDPTQHNKGIGLGLSVCKRIADLHGYILTVSSQKDKGSIFTVTVNNAEEK